MTYSEEVVLDLEDRIIELRAEANQMLGHYSAALDEVYQLRALLAYEALVTKVHLDFATFPKTRRPFAEAQVERMQAAARGEESDTKAENRKYALREAGAPETLTRHQWETNRGRPDR